MKNQKGFTIIEFITATAILLLVVFVLIPFVTEQIKETRKKTFEKEVSEKIVKLADECLPGQNQNFVVGDDDDWQTVEKGSYHINHECAVAVAFYDGMWCSVKDYYQDGFETRQLEDGDRCQLTPLPELSCQPECDQLGDILDLLVAVIFEDDLTLQTLPSIFHYEEAYQRLKEHPEITSSEGQQHYQSMLINLEIDQKKVRLQQGKFYGFPLDLMGTVEPETPYLIIVFNDQDFGDEEAPEDKETAWVFTHVDEKMLCFKTNLIN